MKIVDVIDGVQITQDVYSTFFRCRYDICKGACCTATIKGTPLNGGILTKYEAEDIQQNEIKLLGYLGLSPDTPLFKVTESGITTCLKEDGTCIFSKPGVKECMLKKAHRDCNLLSFSIPMFCNLYPLNYGVVNGFPTLYMDYLWKEHCKAAFIEGERTGMSVIEFCMEPLIKVFGNDFFEKLKGHAVLHRK